MRPWLAAGLTLTRAALDAVETHARASHPDECCGLLLGPAAQPARVDTAERFANLADRYHAADPAAFPRTSRASYVMDAARVWAALARGEAAGRPVKALYHSHGDRGAYFSAEDARCARAEGSLVGEVMWLVTSARAGVAVAEHRLFAYDPAADAFVERPLTVE